jgi:isopenicillin N synthase-like dioxygenase
MSWASLGPSIARMAYVPVIDITAFREGSPEGKRMVGGAVAQACADIGFLQNTGHGIAPERVEAVYRTAKEFFDLPDVDKALCAQPAPDQIRGWSGVGKEGLSYSLGEVAPADLKEKMDMGPFDVPAEPYYSMETAGPHFAPNVWPNGLPAMQPAWEQYFAEMTDLSELMMRIFAVGLGLPEEYFDDKIDKHISMLRALNYPDQPEEPLPGQLRGGAHNDYGGFTLLWQEQRPGGLQVLTKSGEWADVDAVPGAFVLNIGDMLSDWTNGRWVSTMHRVVNPPRDLAHDSRRVSLVFFHTPNYDTVIEPPAQLLAEGEKQLRPSVNAGDYLRDKFVSQTTFGTGQAA